MIMAHQDQRLTPIRAYKPSYNKACWSILVYMQPCACDCGYSPVNRGVELVDFEEAFLYLLISIKQFSVVAKRLRRNCSENLMQLAVVLYFYQFFGETFYKLFKKKTQKQRGKSRFVLYHSQKCLSYVTVSLC